MYYVSYGIILLDHQLLWIMFIEYEPIYSLLPHDKLLFPPSQQFTMH